MTVGEREGVAMVERVRVYIASVGDVEGEVRGNITMIRMCFGEYFTRYYMYLSTNSIHIVIWRSTGLAHCPPGWSLISCSHDVMLHHPTHTHCYASTCQAVLSTLCVHPCPPTSTNHCDLIPTH